MKLSLEPFLDCKDVEIRVVVVLMLLYGLACAVRYRVEGETERTLEEEKFNVSPMFKFWPFYNGGVHVTGS